VCALIVNVSHSNERTKALHPSSWSSNLPQPAPLPSLQEQEEEGVSPTGSATAPRNTYDSNSRLVSGHSKNLHGAFDTINHLRRHPGMAAHPE